VPQLPNTNVAWASYWAEGVSTASENDTQAKAWELLAHMSQTDTMRVFFSSASGVRLFGEIYSRADMADELRDDPIAGAYVEQAQYARSWYMSSHTHDNGINDRIIKYYEDAINIMAQGEPAEDALEPVADGVVQVLSQFGVSAR